MSTSISKKYLSISSIINPNLALNPYWVSGFVDAEGAFTVKLFKLNSSWYVRPVFQLALNVKDELLIGQIKSFFFIIKELYIMTKRIILLVTEYTKLGI